MSTPHSITLDEAQQRCADLIETALDEERDVLVDALPGLGKSLGTPKAVAKTGQPVTMLMPRKELYRQIKHECQRQGISYRVLPAINRDCPTFTGNHGDRWQRRFQDWTTRGASAYEVHELPQTVHGETPPCEANGNCPYLDKMDFNPEDYDLLIGHYTHGYNEDVTKDRTVVIDEFPQQAYLETFESPAPKISKFLASNQEVPFGDFTDLLMHRTDSSRADRARNWFNQQGSQIRKGADVLQDGNAHSLAPLIVYTLLEGEDLGNGWEHANLGYQIGSFNRTTQEVNLLNPPVFENVRNIVALDGTPSWLMWSTALSYREPLLNHQQVLDDDERRSLISNGQGIDIVQTTANTYPYSGRGNADTARDKALLEGIDAHHGMKPSLITTKKAEKAYKRDGVLSVVDEHEHYGNLKGSNRFASERLGVVIGSRHFGDDHVERWGSLFGQDTGRTQTSTSRTYRGWGDHVLRQMREYEVLQAVMRFGRDKKGATVYVHTSALPDWVPRKQGEVVRKRSDGERNVITALRSVNSGTTSEIASEAGCSAQLASNHLGQLEDEGHVTRRKDGRNTVWSFVSSTDLNENFAVDLGKPQKV